MGSKRTKQLRRMHGLLQSLNLVKYSEFQRQFFLQSQKPLALEGELSMQKLDLIR